MSSRAAISAAVAASSGGASARNWSPDSSTHVCHAPAFGSTCGAGSGVAVGATGVGSGVCVGSAVGGASVGATVASGGVAVGGVRVAGGGAALQPIRARQPASRSKRIAE